MKITIVLGAFFPVPRSWVGPSKKSGSRSDRNSLGEDTPWCRFPASHPELPATQEIEGVRHVRVRGFSQPRSILWLKWLDLLYSLRVRRILPAADILVTNTFWLPLLTRTTRRGLLCVHVARGPKGQMRFYAHVARLHAVSRAIADQIVAEAPQLQDRVRVIPNALPFRMDHDVGAAREQTILFVGRVHPEKGLELFLRALSHLPAEMLAAWKIRIVGPHETHLGGGGAAFLRELQALGERSGARVEWPGQIFDPEKLAEEYRNSLVFAYPSVAETGEAFGVAPIEAMAYGCAPFVSNLACFRDYIEDGVTGFVFDQRAAEPEKHLATRLADLLGLGPEQIMRIGAQARAKVAQFDLETVAQRYLDDFASLLPNE